MAVTKEMIMTDILDMDENIAEILMQMGLHCVGCMAASGESLEQAMYVHGYSPEDVNIVVTQLNTYLGSRTKAAI